MLEIRAYYIHNKKISYFFILSIDKHMYMFTKTSRINSTIMIKQIMSCILFINQDFSFLRVLDNRGFARKFWAFLSSCKLYKYLAMDIQDFLVFRFTSKHESIIMRIESCEIYIDQYICIWKACLRAYYMF